MKKKKNGKKRAEKVAGDSPDSGDSPSIIDQSLEEVGASYVPDYITINNKPVKVWMNIIKCDPVETSESKWTITKDIDILKLLL